MTCLRRNTFWRPVRRRLWAWLALGSYLATVVGLPLPASSPKDHSQPFPCQNRLCGCQNAEQCWRHCCCFTPEERWAWAEAHHVQPPAYAERPAGPSSAKSRTKVRSTCSCCVRHNIKEACCDLKSPPPAAVGPRTDDALHSSPRPGRAGGLRWGPALSALHCQGLSTLWATTGPVLPPPLPVTWDPSRSPVGWLSYPEAPLLCVSHRPPDPPPRLHPA